MAGSESLRILDTNLQTVTLDHFFMLLRQPSQELSLLERFSKFPNVFMGL